ncbi:cytochrome c3 family protein, partial [bacterium]|nr:cytochrome c3 family protein [bacterium]
MSIRPSLLVLLTVWAGASGAGGAESVNPHGSMSLECSACHTEESWRVTRSPEGFDHAVTGFTLEGLHGHVECRDCHQDLRFAFVGIRCADCHDDFHKGRLGPACEECHTPDGWTDRDELVRRHDATPLPLVGAHARLDCEACHVGAVASDYAGTPSDCFQCHAAQYEATSNPPHAAAGLGTDCVRCHGVFAATWGPGDFVHSPAFPLEGGHAGLECMSCHTTDFSALPLDCASCHLEDFNDTDDPDHEAGGFPQDCTQCHSTQAWQPASFDHDLTSFPLTGEHVEVDCASCHTAGYTGTPTACQSCHLDDYNEADDPDHAGSGFPLDCAQCHQTTDWDGAQIDHDQTAFPLTGEHLSVDCASCHTAGYTGTPTACESCHLDDYNGTTDPD